MQFAVLEILPVFALTFDLFDIPHRVFMGRQLIIIPVEEGSEIADVVVDGGNADRLTVVASSFGTIGCDAIFVGIKAVLTSFLQITDVMTNGCFSHFVRGRNVLLLRCPTFK